MTKLLRDVAEGSIVKLKESGIPVEFYVAKHDYEAALNGGGRTLLVRKECYDNRQLHNTAVNVYENSDMDVWLNGEYKALLDTTIQTAIEATTFYCAPGNSQELTTTNTLSRSVFLLSSYEMGQTHVQTVVVGSALPTADTLKVAYYNGNAVMQWTRSPYQGSDNMTRMSTSGGIMYASPTDKNYSRPAFTLLSTEAYVADDGIVTVNPPVISGEDTDLGARPSDFSVDYSVSTKYGNNLTVTEAVNNTIIRTYTAQSGEAQTMNVSVEGLSLGQHIASITADIGGVTAERYYTFTVPAVWLNHGDTELGDKIGNFSIDYTAESFSGNDVTITELLDGEVQRSYTAQSGAEQGMSIAMKSVIDGAHSATLTAECGENVARATFNFNVPAITLHDGGTVQEFQDENSNPVFPATMAKAVFTTSGESVERKLSDMVSGLNGVTELVEKGVKIATGSYTGTGNLAHTITLGFRPKFVMILQADSNAAYGSPYGLFWNGTPKDSANGIQRTFSVTDSTFSIRSGDHFYCAAMNGNGTKYYYFAIG